ncbi:DUF998 domain-containing protein [Streptomyces sp. NPDC091272]|uniref:DUF998 domain-containing protein n=1 Tax=Streptomyces sp. NPDC091272 TaxID=3365981 RepID=UPI0037FD8E96
MASDKPTAPRDTQHSGRRRRLVVCSLVAGALLYNAWILESAVPTALDPRHSYVSELYAADQSFRPLFAALDLSGAVLIVMGAVAWRWPGGGVGRWALAGFGACSVADVLFPLDCAPSLVPGCSPVHPVHTVTSALVHFFLFASMASLTWCAGRARGPGRRGAVGRWGLPLMGAALLSSVATVGPLLGHPGWHGLPQRLHVVLVGVWLLLLAYDVRAGGDRSAATPPGDAGGAQDSTGASAPRRVRAAVLGLFEPGRARPGGGGARFARDGARPGPGRARPAGGGSDGEVPSSGPAR